METGAIHRALALAPALAALGGCLSPPEEARDRVNDAASAVGDGAATSIECSEEQVTGGNLVYFSFEDPDPLVNQATGVAAATGDGAIGVGRYGNGLVISGVAARNVLLGDRIAFAPPLTVEAWVNLNAGDLCQTLVSDWSPDVEPPNLSLEIAGTADDRPRLWSRDDGGAIQWVQAADEGALTIADWRHVAVSWDGQIVRFFLDGAEVGAEVMDSSGPREPLEVRLGTRADETCPLRGRVDEIKVSSCVKSQAQLAASAAFDPTG